MGSVLGKGGSSSAPPAPDPVKTANAQAAANKETAIAQSQLNMVNQYTPNGSLEYTQRGTSADGTPQYSATQTLSPEQQKLLDLQNQAGAQYGQTANNQLGQVSGALSTPLDFSTLGSYDDARQKSLDSTLARLQPQSDRQLSGLQTQLANQGIGYGSDAWKSAMDDYNRGQNDRFLAADQYAGTDAMTQRNQAINEMVQQRQIPLNELSAMMAGTQVQQPNFISPSQTQINPADLLGATYASYNGQLNAYNAQQGTNSANNQGLFGLIGAGANAYASNPGAFSFSDMRLKTNIERVGDDPRGFGVYDFDYVWGGERQRGVMAQEVLDVIPDAVATHESGYLMVNYGAL